METPTIVCNVCGQAHAQVRLMTRSYGKGPNLLVIENIPVIVCPIAGKAT